MFYSHFATILFFIFSYSHFCSDSRRFVFYKFELKYKKVSKRTQTLPFETTFHKPTLPDPIHVKSRLREAFEEKMSSFNEHLDQDSNKGPKKNAQKIDQSNFEKEKNEGNQENINEEGKEGKKWEDLNHIEETANEILSRSISRLD